MLLALGGVSESRESWSQDLETSWILVAVGTKVKLPLEVLTVL
jgi:hypothetical protein